MSKDTMAQKKILLEFLVVRFDVEVQNVKRHNVEKILGMPHSFVSCTPQVFGDSQAHRLGLARFG
jgi:hypothetical protein